MAKTDAKFNKPSDRFKERKLKHKELRNKYLDATDDVILSDEKFQKMYLRDKPLLEKIAPEFDWNNDNLKRWYLKYAYQNPPKQGEKDEPEYLVRKYLANAERNAAARAAMAQFMSWLFMDKHAIRFLKEQFSKINDEPTKDGKKRRFASFHKNRPDLAAHLWWYAFLIALGTSVTLGTNAFGSRDKLVDQVRRIFGASEKDVADAGESHDEEWDNQANKARKWGKYSDVSRRYDGGYGYLFSPRDASYQYHFGIDIKGAEAQTDGEVLKVVSNNGKQNYIVVKKPNGNYACYLHLVDIRVAEGQKIKAGEILGAPHQDVHHIHYFVSTRNIANRSDFTSWMTGLDIAETIGDITAVRPGLNNEILFSDKYVFVANYLRQRKGQESIRQIIERRTFDIDNQLIREAVRKYEESAGLIEEVEIRQGVISRKDVSRADFVRQVRELHPAIYPWKLLFERNSQAGYREKDGKDTGWAGMRRDYTGPRVYKKVKLGVPMIGFTWDRTISDKEKKLGFQKYEWFSEDLTAKDVYDNIKTDISYAEYFIIQEVFWQYGSPTIRQPLINFMNTSDHMDHPDKLIDILLKYYIQDYGLKGKVIPTFLFRRGVGIAMLKGDISPAAAGEFQSVGSYFDSPESWRAFFVIEKGKYKYKFNRAEFERVQMHKEPDPYALESEGGVILNLPVGDMLPYTATGWPRADDELVIEKERTPEKVRSASADSIAKSTYYYNAASASYDKYVRSGEKDTWLPDWIEKQDLHDAEKFALTALAYNPGNVSAKSILALVAYQNRDWNTCATIASEIINQMPDDTPDDSYARVRLLNVAAKSFERLGLWFRAYNNYYAMNDRLGDFDPNDPESLPTDGVLIKPASDEKIDNLMTLAGEVPPALLDAQKTAKTNPDSALVKFDAFVNASDAWKNYMPQHISTGYVGMAEIFLAKHDTINAARNYRLAYDANNEGRAYLFKAVSLYSQMGDWKSVIAYGDDLCANKLFDDDPEIQAESWAMMGRAHAALKEYKLALEKYGKAQKLNPIYQSEIDRIRAEFAPPKIVVTSVKFQSLRDAKKYKEVVSLAPHIEKSGASSREKGKMYNTVGMSYKELGDIANAIKYLRMAVDANPRLGATVTVLKDLEKSQGSGKKTPPAPVKPAPAPKKTEPAPKTTPKEPTKTPDKKPAPAKKSETPKLVVDTRAMFAAKSVNAIIKNLTVEGIKNSTLLAADKAELLYILGRALESTKKYDKAYEAYKAALSMGASNFAQDAKARANKLVKNKLVSKEKKALAYVSAMERARAISSGKNLYLGHAFEMG